MIVDTMSSRQVHNWYSKSTNKQTETLEKTSNDYTSAHTTDFTSKKSNFSNVWGELARKYNVRNANFDDIKSISKALYDSGEISLKEVAVMTFDNERASNYLKQNARAHVPDDFNMYQTPSNSSGKRNWITEFEARAQKDFEYGNLIGYHNSKKVLSIFQKIGAV
ncbi:hypothetical protein [Radiobacillus deserti]|uniref:Uncharacterized protein n=1 Tax=Radiobacillus deserti TaxID=2594883 RepID=A0A516KHI8_9BACI|nr:hypothetical protein [Radiobacillus deserti]QDP40873.1 hypothetical protein FN924_12155 [Radiobacillus deserti]